MIIEMVKMHDS